MWCICHHHEREHILGQECSHLLLRAKEAIGHIISAPASSSPSEGRLNDNR
jgi:hypothetical protein